jgi:cytochrome c
LLALYGDWENRRLPACQQCHGPLGIGAGDELAFLPLWGEQSSHRGAGMHRIDTAAALGSNRSFTRM